MDTVTQKPALTLVQKFKAAPEKVWRAWTDAEAIKKWWGPGNEPVSLAELDVRVGGRFRIVFGGPDGRAHDVQGVYRDVSRTASWCSPGPGPTAHPSASLW